MSRRRLGPIVALLEDRTLLSTPTLTALAASAGSLVYGQSEMLTATVTTYPTSTTTPSGGTVSFMDGSSTLVTEGLTNGTATFSTTALGVGSHVLTAAYSGDAAFMGSSTPLTASSIIATIAGGGNGNGDPATGTSLSSPVGIALDAAGDIFIADSANNVIREVNASTKVISTVAGNGLPGYTGDGGQATAALLDDPSGIAIDAGGDIFIADSANNVIRELHASTGVINTVAGDGTAGYTGDRGQATSATLNDPSTVAVDSAGDLFVTDTGNDVIREVNGATGVITTVAGNGTAGYGGNGGQATAAELKGPIGVALDSSGNIYIADTGNNAIREVTGGVIKTIAGTTTAGYSGNGGQATAARLTGPAGITVDASGNIYIADTGNNAIRKVAGGLINTVAGNGTAGYSGDGGQATAATPGRSSAVAVDSSGDIFIADTINTVIRKVTGGVINTVAGNGFASYSGDGGQATAAELGQPAGVVVNAAGDIFIADSNNNVIREVNPTTGVITTFAGDGIAGYSGDKGQATAAELYFPQAVALDSAGDLFIADSDNCVIREVNASTGVITTVAGNGNIGYTGDHGQATAAEMFDVLGVAVDAAGDVYIADSGNNVIREVKAATGVITTVAGNGTAGYTGDNGQATAAKLDFPTGIALDSAGDILSPTPTTT